jgi:two-component system cell cycle sensor histidine kinase/response regulator CckA
LWVGIATLAIALAGSFAVSRRLTLPLTHLADVAREIATGNWARQVPVNSGTAEARIMANAFNDMTRTLRHWHQEAKSQADRVQEAYERFRAVTDSANDAIVSVDSEGRIVFWNRRAQTVFGYTPDEALGQPLATLFVDTDGEILRDLASPNDPGRTIELDGRRRDNSRVPVELSLSTWRAGPEVFYTAVIRDITERRQSQEVLREREAQLRQAQKMEAIGRLAGGVAHDFNNVLTAILGYADFLLEDVAPPSRPDVEGIQKAARTAAALTRQLLAFSRQQVIQPEIVDVNTIVANTEKLLRRLLREDVEMRLKLEPDLPAMKADPGQIEQIVLNLAVNARDAMPDGGTLTIETSCETNAPGSTRGGMAVKSGPCVLLTVSDTGCGMTEDVKSRIFEPFFTTKAFGKGTGLGLATVYGIVQQMEGYVEVDSEPGRGARFRVCLPALDAAAAKPDERKASTTHVGGSENILVVEDNESVRAFTTDALTRSGYRVFEAENGEQGIRVAQERGGAIDLVITDVVMPVMGGRALASRLRAMFPNLKIIFTSGHMDDRSTVEPGMPFIHKPFSPPSLLRLVREVLDSVP